MIRLELINAHHDRYVYCDEVTTVVLIKSMVVS